MREDQVIAGRYRLHERVGSGGMGTVWQAYDERLHRKVAVKQVFMPSALSGSQADEVTRRTMREGRIAAKLHHPQLITVFDVVEDDGQPFLIMEYLPSTSLSQVLADRGPLPPEEVAAIGAEAAGALAAAHLAGVVHRDVKPANILIGDEGTVKITDFGISRVVEDVTGTATGTFAGSPAYLSPEVAKGKPATFASDVFSLGATLYTAVEGTPPAGDSENAMGLLYRVASGQVRPPERAGPLTDVLMWLLDEDPDKRPTMTEASAALAARGSVAEPVTAPVVAPAAEPGEPVEPAEPFAPVAEPVAESPSPEPVREVEQPQPAPKPEPEPAAPAAATGRTRNRGFVVAAALLVLVIAGTLVALLLNRDDDPAGGNPAAGTTTEESPGRAGQTDDAGQPGGTGEPGEPGQSEQPSSSTSAGSPPTQANPPVEPPAPTTPATAITSYYALMPANLDAAWPRLTPKYQQNPAGGRDGYARFWGQMNAVTVTEVTPGQGTVVEATVQYSFKDGRQIRERHRYTLVEQGGQWLIDESTVLSVTPV